MRPWRIGFTALLATLMMVTAAGCRTITEEKDTSVERELNNGLYGDGLIRDDVEPLTKRYPAIEALTGAQWSSGTMGPSDSFAPTDYWIDAIVELPPQDHADLHIGSLHQEDLPGAFYSELASLAPPGPYQTSEELSELFRHRAQESITVLLVDDGRTIILSTSFE